MAPCRSARGSRRSVGPDASARARRLTHLDANVHSMGLRRAALVTIVNGRARCVVGVAGGCVEAWPGELRDIAEQPGRVRLQHPQRAPAASRRSGTPSSVAPGRQPRAGAGGNRHQPVEHQGHLSGWPLSHSEEIGGRIVRGSVSGPRGCPTPTAFQPATERPAVPRAA